MTAWPFVWTNQPQGSPGFLTIQNCKSNSAILFSCDFLSLFSFFPFLFLFLFPHDHRILLKCFALSLLSYSHFTFSLILFSRMFFIIFPLVLFHILISNPLSEFPSYILISPSLSYFSLVCLFIFSFLFFSLVLFHILISHSLS